MNVQLIIVMLIFAAAIFYIARMVYKNITSKKGCGGCGKCGADFSGIKPASSK